MNDLIKAANKFSCCFWFVFAILKRCLTFGKTKLEPLLVAAMLSRSIKDLAG